MVQVSCEQDKPKSFDMKDNAKKNIAGINQPVRQKM